MVAFRAADATIYADREKISAQRWSAPLTRGLEAGDVWVEDLPGPSASALVDYLEGRPNPISKQVARPLAKFAQAQGLLDLKQRCERAMDGRGLVRGAANAITRAVLSPVVSVVRRGQRAALALRGFSSKHVETSAGRMHLLEARGKGSLPTIVVIHGFCSAGADFLPVLPQLRAASQRVLAPDMPGHGFSDHPKGGIDAQVIVRALEETLDRAIASGEKVILVGNSLGGLAATLLALRRPERVAGLFLSSPAGASMSERELGALLETFDLHGVRESETFVGRLFAKAPPMRKIAARVARAMVGERAGRELRERCRTSDFLSAEQLQSLSMPVHVSWGRDDHILPRAQLEFFRAHLPEGSTVEEPEACGHFPIFDDADQLGRDVVRFAGRVARAATPSSLVAQRPSPPRQ